MREILDAELKKHPIANANTFLRAQELAADLRVKHPHETKGLAHDATTGAARCCDGGTCC